jgi:hypothetical protein
VKFWQRTVVVAAIVGSAHLTACSTKHDSWAGSIVALSLPGSGDDSGTAAYEKTISAFGVTPIATSAIFILSGPAGAEVRGDTVVELGRSSRYGPVPCNLRLSDPLRTFAISDDGKLVVCLSKVYGPSELWITNLVTHRKSQIHPSVQLFSNPGGRSIGFDGARTLLALALDESCSRGPDMFPTRLISIDLDRAGSRRLGPCTLSITSDGSSVVISTRNENTNNAWKFAVLSDNPVWIEGEPQAADMGRVLYITSGGDLRWTGSNDVILKHAAAARYTRLSLGQIK